MTTRPSDHPLNPWQIYWIAARPRTLPASAAPVVIGSAVAWVVGKFQLAPALAILAAALLLQIGSNIANDVYDFYKGADTAERQGPLRVTAGGLWKPDETMLAMWLTFGLAAVLGLYLAWVGGWPVVVMGLVSILAAILYTGGPFPLGYFGLGDPFVFIFFGLVAEMGTFYIQAHTLTALAVWSAVPVGLLVTNVLVVNNLRDIETDRAAHKFTLAVLLGVDGTHWQFTVLMALAYLAPLVLWLSHLASILGLLSWGSLVIGIPLLRTVWTKQGRSLNLALAAAGRLSLLYAILYSLGLGLGKLLGI